MRTTINHTPPAGMQAEPTDNTSGYVTPQVALFNRDRLPTSSTDAHTRHIHTQSAMEIAAWWQAPRGYGADFAAFASTGTITEDLTDAIASELTVWANALRESRDPTDRTEALDNRAALRALDAYVRACTVRVWSVGSNHAGYMPEGDVVAFMDYPAAVNHFTDMVKEAPDALTDETDDCTCVDGGEACDFHSLEAQVGAYLTDSVPHVWHGPNGWVVNGEPRDLLLYLRPDDRPLPTAYWVAAGEMTVAEYRASKED